MLNERQIKISDILKKNPDGISAVKLFNLLALFFPKLSKITVIRDLNKLISENKVIKEGSGRAIIYKNALDTETYFDTAIDKRKLKSESFNFEIFNEVENMFSDGELEKISKINEQYKNNRKKLSQTLLKKEYERLTIELAWKSSQIEGNTYSLLDTEKLIKESEEAIGKKHEEAIMILNHKKALDFIFLNADHFKNLSVKKIEELHQILMDGLNVRFGIRNAQVGIIGTKYRPLDNKFQIKEALENLTDIINKTKNPFQKALQAVLIISYIQPFEDGNKRTARILSNAILLAYDYCPLSYRSVDETEYKKAIVIFYEQNNFNFFKQLFVEQFVQSVMKYF